MPGKSPSIEPQAPGPTRTRAHRAPPAPPSRASAEEPRAAPSASLDAHGRARACIQDVTPRVDDGRFAAKRIVGDRERARFSSW